MIFPLLLLLASPATSPATGAGPEARIRGPVAADAKPPALKSKAPVTVQCHVRYVYDGDTFEADCHDPVTDLIVRRKIRLDSVDAPETPHGEPDSDSYRPGQPFGEAARGFVKDLILDRRVNVTISKTDKYDRQIGSVVLPDKSDLGARLVGAGLAWRYKWFCRTSAEGADEAARCDALAALETAARTNKTGLWSEADPVEPCRFRGSCK